MSNDREIEQILNWSANEVNEKSFDENFQIKTRDMLQAKLDNYYVEIKESLLIAVMGELGNNSFDHNSGRWRDVQGVFLKTDNLTRKIIIADRGCGLKATLKRVAPEIISDMDAIKIAFTRVVSGRSPENRGNGLKFVSSVVQKKDWQLFFQSGKAYAEVGINGIEFFDSQADIKGCIAILRF